MAPPIAPKPCSDDPVRLVRDAQQLEPGQRGLGDPAAADQLVAARCPPTSIRNAAASRAGAAVPVVEQRVDRLHRAQQPDLGDAAVDESCRRPRSSPMVQ